MDFVLLTAVVQRQVHSHDHRLRSSEERSQSVSPHLPESGRQPVVQGVTAHISRMTRWGSNP
jgi:hypothetical protein